MTDTDSFVYHIKETGIFDIIKNSMDEFDLSDYPKQHELYNPKNKKVIGKFKNESIKQIIKFVGLRSKLYSYLTDNNKNIKKCKGIKKCVVDEMTHEDYNRSLIKRKGNNKKKSENI